MPQSKMQHSPVRLIFIASLFLFVLLLLPKGFIGAEGEGECTCSCSCTCYAANSTGKNPNIFRGTCLQGCPNCPCSCSAKLCSGQSICEDCGGWQIATRITSGENVCQQGACVSTLWGQDRPECKACKDYVEKPKNPTYYSNPLCPFDPWGSTKEPDKTACQNKKQAAKNVYLPVKLDWEDVEGWIEGWKLPEKKVVMKSDGGRCEVSFDAGKSLVDCMGKCKNDCWKKMEEEWTGPEKDPNSKWNLCECKTAKERAEKEVEKEQEYRDYLPKCIRECEKKCINDNKISASSPCPYSAGRIFHCDPDTDYVKSYIIEIKGNMRDPETLKKIAILERENELIEKFFEATVDGPLKVNENEEEIRKSKEENLEVTFFGAVLDKSEFIPPYAGFFKSNRTYQWRVRACIKEYKSYKEYEEDGGKTCGDWSDWWEFKTNPTPEPALPYDPDWAGEKKDYPTSCCISGKSKDIPKWEIRFLRWAEINDKEFEDEKKAEGKRCREWSYNTNQEKTEKENKPPYYLESGIVEKAKTEAQIKKRCQDNYCLNVLSRQEKDDADVQLYCRPLAHSVMLTYRYQDTEQDKCHPQLTIKEEKGGEKCIPKNVYPFPSGWPREEPFFPFPQFENNKYEYFTKLTSYSWKVDACIEISADKCTDWSQKWRFSVENFSLKKPEVVSPPNAAEPEVGLPVTLAWSQVEGAMSYRYKGSFGSGKVYSSDITFDYPELKLSTTYTWQALPCWGYEGEWDKCEDEDKWSDIFTFRTTGRPPKTMEPLSGLPPVTFKWEDVPGAKSYRFYIYPYDPYDNDSGPSFLTVEKVTKEPRVDVDWPQIKLNSLYQWYVVTCARDGGGLCGYPTDNKPLFTVFPLTPPDKDKFQPTDNHKFTVGDDYILSWDAVEKAKFYKYKVEYISKAEEETSEYCQLGIITSGGESGEMTIATSVFVPLECLGEYKWQVKSCIGGFCETVEDGSFWSSPSVFSLAPAPPPPEGAASLVPCGRKSNDPNTPWDETDPCEIGHLFLLIEKIFNFIIEKIIPLSLAVFFIATGVIFYFSRGLPTVVVDVKRLWKAAGIGYGLVILAWTIVTLILMILGFNFGIFGYWWKI